MGRTPAECEIRIETIQTDSFSMDYFRFGHGEGTLVILPGLSVQSVMSSAHAIANSYKLLTDDFTIYVFDRRKELPDTYSLHEMAQDTADALRALGLKRASLFGASQGGMIAMAIAIEQPDLVQKLILCSTSARVEETQYQTVEKWVQLAKAGSVEDLFLAFGEAIYPQNMFELLRALLIKTAKSVTQEDLNRFIILADSMRGFDVTDELEKIACPVFAIGSKDDRILGADETLRIAEHLGNRSDFELFLYDGYGHAVYDIAPDFKERMLDFLIK